MNIKHSSPTISSQEIQAVTAALRSGQLSQGKQVVQLERQFAQYHGEKSAVAVNSGTSALHLALLALGINAKHQVILPTYVCTALINVIQYTGATPILVDVNREDGNIAVDQVKKKLNRKVKAILVPHMFGLPADIKSLIKLGVPVIEDCAQSIGAKVDGKKVGTFGTLGIFSFYATKMITCGEGGMIVAKSESLINELNDLRDYDHKVRYRVRYNYKMTDFQAACGSIQLKRLGQFINRRKIIAKYYNKTLKGLGLELPGTVKGRESISYRYVLRSKHSANSVIAKLKRRGVDAERPLFKPIHQYLNKSSFPQANYLSNQSFSIPIYPTLKQTQVKKIVETLIKTFS